MIFNVDKGVFSSFSTRHQFYTFTKLKSFPRFPSSLQLFLFFRFLLFLLSLAPSHSIYSRSLQFFSPFLVLLFSPSAFPLFSFYFFSPLTCPVPLYLLEIQSCFLRLATRYLHGRRSNLQWMIDLPIFRAKSLAKRLKKCHCFGKYIYMAQFKVNGLIFHALIWHISLFNGL